MPVYACVCVCRASSVSQLSGQATLRQVCGCGSTLQSHGLEGLGVSSLQLCSESVSLRRMLLCQGLQESKSSVKMEAGTELVTRRKQTAVEGES